MFRGLGFRGLGLRVEIPREAIRFSGPSLQGFGPKWQRLPTLAFLGWLKIIQMREALRLLGPKSKIASTTKIHFGWQNWGFGV